MADSTPAPPALPDVGSTDWYAWAAWMHAQALGASSTYAPLLGVLATVSTAVTPTVGKTQKYSAAAGALAPALPALSGLVAGSTFVGVQKDTGDASTNYVTVTTSVGDTFDSGATAISLRVAGELRELQVVSIGGTKYWKVVGGNTPLPGLDTLYVGQAALPAAVAGSIQSGQTDPQAAVDARVNTGSQSVKPRMQASIRRQRKRPGTKVALPSSVTFSATSAALSTSAPVTSIPVTALGAALPAGVIVVNDGTNRAQPFFTTGAAVGATSVPVLSTTPWANHASGATVTRGFQGSNLPINLFYDGGSFTTDFNVTKYRNTGTTISTGLTSAIGRGTTVSTITCAALTAAVAAGDTVVLFNGSTAQPFVASAAAASGATSISVSPTVALAPFGLGTPVNAQSWYFVDVDSGVTANTGKAVTTLSAPLAPGAAVTSVPVNALPLAMASGRTIVIYSGSSSQAWTLSAAAAAGATALTVTSQVPNAIYPAAAMVVSPNQTILKAYTVAVSGDEIRLLDRASNVRAGMQFRGNGTLGNSSQQILKSVNLVGHFPGEAKLIVGDNLTYTQNGTYPVVWQATRSNMQKFVDIAHPASPQGITYTNVASIAACAALPGSWYSDGTTVYVHTTDELAPDNTRHLGLIGGYHLWADNSAAQVSFYLQDITLIGGQYGTLRASQTSASNGPTNTYLKGVQGWWGTGTDTHANMVNYEAGGVCYSQGCLMMGGEKDGFNYSGTVLGGITYSSRFIEVDCVSHSCGLSRTIAGDTNNGTTAHTGAVGVRVNGAYYYHAGTPIADVQIGTQAVDVDLEGYDSMSQTNSVSCANSAQQPGTEKWILAGRYFVGAMVPGVTPVGDIQASANTVVHLAYGPQYDTSAGTFTTAA